MCFSNRFGNDVTPYGLVDAVRNDEAAEAIGTSGQNRA